MTLTIAPPEPPQEAEAAPEPQRDDEAPLDEILVAGRPVEDRSFEAVEAGAGLVAGMMIGTAVAGPIGTAVGGLVGAAAGLVAGEALERHEGRAAETTDARERELVPHR